MELFELALGATCHQLRRSTDWIHHTDTSCAKNRAHATHLKTNQQVDAMIWADKAKLSNLIVSHPRLCPQVWPKALSAVFANVQRDALSLQKVTLVLKNSRPHWLEFRGSDDSTIKFVCSARLGFVPSSERILR